jgi:hypothetical protein
MPHMQERETTITTLTAHDFSTIERPCELTTKIACGEMKTADSGALDARGHYLEELFRR